MKGEINMNKVENAIEEINEIKKTMIKSGNDISRIVYSISTELSERNACRDFAIKTGMSKASISKMVYAEETRKTLGINDTISYNLIYRLKDIMCEDIAIMLDKGMTEQEIRNTLTTSTEVDTDTHRDTVTDTDIDTNTDTETETQNDESYKEIVSQIWDILEVYNIEKEDKKLLKMLIKGLK